MHPHAQQMRVVHLFFSVMMMSKVEWSGGGGGGGGGGAEGVGGVRGHSEVTLTDLKTNNRKPCRSQGTYTW